MGRNLTIYGANIPPGHAGTGPKAKSATRGGRGHSVAKRVHKAKHHAKKAKKQKVKSTAGTFWDALKAAGL